MIKKLLRPLFHWIRSIVVPHAPQDTRLCGRLAVRTRFADIKHRLATESPSIIDGGANRGALAELFLPQYEMPVIHAFEPMPELVDMLKQKFADSRNVTVHGTALGGRSKDHQFQYYKLSVFVFRTQPIRP